MLHDSLELPRGSGASSAISHSFDDWLCGRSGGAGSGGKPDKAGAVFSCSIRLFRELVFSKRYKSGVPCIVPRLMPSRTVGRLRCSTAREGEHHERRLDPSGGHDRILAFHFSRGTVQLRAVATCDAALKTCNARKSAGMTAAPNCEAAAAECRKTGVWRGVSDRGPYECLMPSR